MADAGPAPAVAARDATPTRARAARRLRRLALCGLAQSAAAPDSGGAELLRTAAAAAPSGAPRPLAAPSRMVERRGQLGERHGLAARALSEMLCAESHAARCRATVRRRRCQLPSQPLSVRIRTRAPRLEHWH